MRLFAFLNATARERQLQTEVDDLKAQLAARDRTIAVQQEEIKAQAAVIVRDQERVKTETAATIRQRAEHEGATNDLGSNRRG